MNDRPAHYVVAVASGKRGVGKSTSSLHLALAKRVFDALRQRAAA